MSHSNLRIKIRIFPSKVQWPLIIVARRRSFVIVVNCINKCKFKIIITELFTCVVWNETVASKAAIERKVGCSKLWYRVHFKFIKFALLLSPFGIWFDRVVGKSFTPLWVWYNYLFSFHLMTHELKVEYRRILLTQN